MFFLLNLTNIPNIYPFARISYQNDRKVISSFRTGSIINRAENEE